MGEPWPRDAGAGIVEFPDGRRVRGRGLRRPAPHGPAPDLRVVLLGRPPVDEDGELWWIRWPDFRTPSDDLRAVEVLTEAFRRAGRERVEVACGGGIGRTGTALALMATCSGVAADHAVDWVRARYHPRAAETPWQRHWVRRHGVRGPVDDR